MNKEQIVELSKALNSAAQTMDKAVQSATGSRATIHQTRAKEILATLQLAIKTITAAPAHGEGELREALEPFADAAMQCNPAWPDNKHLPIGFVFTVGDVRRASKARDALSHAPSPPQDGEIKP